MKFKIKTKHLPDAPEPEKESGVDMRICNSCPSRSPSSLPSSRDGLLTSSRRKRPAWGAVVRAAVAASWLRNHTNYGVTFKQLAWWSPRIEFPTCFQWLFKHLIFCSKSLSTWNTYSDWLRFVSCHVLWLQQHLARRPVWFLRQWQLHWLISSHHINHPLQVKYYSKAKRTWNAKWTKILQISGTTSWLVVKLRNSYLCFSLPFYVYTFI